jgi:hypothetical protein
MTQTKPDLGRPTALAHLDEEAQRGRLIATGVSVLVYLIAVVPTLSALADIPRVAALVGAAGGVGCLVMIVEGRRYGATGACFGGLVGTGLRIAQRTGSSVGPIAAIVTASALLIAVETATHASRYRSVAPPAPTTSKRRVVATLQTAGFGLVGSLMLITAAGALSHLPVHEGLIIGVVGLAAVLGGIWLSVGDVDRLVSPEPSGEQFGSLIEYDDQ